jgi:hypothetical protein
MKKIAMNDVFKERPDQQSAHEQPGHSKEREFLMQK